MDSSLIEHIAIGAVGVAIIAFGILLFVGSRKCFSMVAGGNDFLAMNPDDATFKRSARQAGLAVWLVVAVMWCFDLQRSVDAIGLMSDAAGAVRAACAIVIAASVLAIVVIIVLQLRTHARLLKEER